MKIGIRNGFGMSIALLAAAFFFVNANAQPSLEIYRKVAISINNSADFSVLSGDGLIFDHIHTKRNISGGWEIEAILNPQEFEILQNSGLNYTVLVGDMGAEIRNREPLSAAEKQRIRSESGIQGFGFGSMGGFYTYAEVVAELDSMRLNYPNLVGEKFSIGQTIEGRDIWAIKISDNPDIDEAEPEVLYDALHHAREPQGMMTLLYFMYHLLENYDVSPEIGYLVNNRELFFIPVMNPDGYVYNQTTNPNGGGFWRKNRRNNGSSFGVDLNRNYGYEWGYDNDGSSPNPGSDSYRGTAPFSEPETQAYRDFVLSRDIRLDLSYHTYSNVLIYPFGYKERFLTPDSLLFIEYGKEMTRVNNYSFGTVFETLGYVANGGTFDWLYGEQALKGKIISFSPEVGSSLDGFWPSQSRIYPLAIENLSANMFLAWMGGSFVMPKNATIREVESGDGFFERGEEIAIVIGLQNAGLDSSAEISYQIEPADEFLQIISGGSGSVTGLGARSVAASDTVFAQINPETPPGYAPQLAVSITENGLTRTDTLRNMFNVGVPIALFSNSAEDGLLGWNPGNWGLTGNTYVSPLNSFTDSPSGSYPSNVNNAFTLQFPINLSGVTSAFLEYYTKWDIEPGYDFAQVKISTNGTSWQPLSAPNMVPGSGDGVQTTGEPGYHSVQSQWIKESIDISDYAGESSVYLRFVIESDGFVEGDGWYLDDIQVLSYTTTVGVEQVDETAPNAFSLDANYPNPFNPETAIQYAVATPSQVKLTVYNMLGERVATLLDERQSSGTYVVNWNAGQFASGVYLVRMQAGAFAKSIKIVLNK